MSAKKKYTLRSKDVAHILDCSPDDVGVLARSGELTAKKKGRFWKFQPSDVEAFKRRKKKKS